MTKITLKIDAAKYQDEDDCLAAAAADAAETHGCQGWDLSPRWADDQRDAILVDVPFTKVRLGCQMVDYDAAVNLMDDDLREQIAAKLELACDGLEERQVFLDEYASAHERAFGKPFVVA